MPVCIRKTRKIKVGVYFKDVFPMSKLATNPNKGLTFELSFAYNFVEIRFQVHGIQAMH